MWTKAKDLKPGNWIIREPIGDMHKVVGVEPIEGLGMVELRCDFGGGFALPMDKDVPYIP